MRFAGINRNDFTAGEGVCLTVYTQGCHFHCPGCHNPETHDFNGGKEFSMEDMNKIIQGINANDIKRDLAIQGGEPLAPENLFLTNLIIQEVRKVYPYIKVYLWTGYTLEQLKERDEPTLKQILDSINVIIDGPYKQEQRDITLKMRGSSNQRITYLR